MNDTYTEAGPADRLSKQRFDMGLRCWQQFFQRYVLGNKQKPGLALIFGGAHDKMCDQVYEHKIETGVTASAEDCRGIWADKFGSRLDEVEDPETDTGKLIDLGVNLAAAWRDISAVDTVPVQTQIEFHFPLTYLTKEQEKKQVDVMGYMDLIKEPTLEKEVAPNRIITEHKTSGRSWNQSTTNGETQGVLYSIAATKVPEIQMLGVNPNEVHFDVAVKNKKPKVQNAANDPAMIRRLDQAERTGMMKQMALFHQQVEANLKSGTWLPNRKGMLCSKKFCGYWQSCVAEFGGQVKD